MRDLHRRLDRLEHLQPTGVGSGDTNAHLRRLLHERGIDPQAVLAAGGSIIVDGDQGTYLSVLQVIADE